MGRHNMEVWYQSPYPDDAAKLPKLYLCEFCLRYQKSEITMKRHAAKCVWRHPPGDEVSSTFYISKSNSSDVDSIRIFCISFSRSNRFIEKVNSVCGKWMASDRSSIVSICVYWQSFSWTTKHFTTMSNHFYFMS